MSNDHSMREQSRLLVEQAIDDAMDDLARRNAARARQEAARAGTPRDRYARIGVGIAVPVLVGVVLWNLTTAPLLAARVLGPATSRQEAERAFKRVIDDIEAFVADYGDVPVSLAEVGLPTEGEWHYARLANDRYRLDMAYGGHAITFTR